MVNETKSDEGSNVTMNNEDKQDKLVTMAVHDMESLLNENKSLRSQVNHLLALVNILVRH